MQECPAPASDAPRQPSEKHSFGVTTGQDVDGSAHGQLCSGLGVSFSFPGWDTGVISGAQQPGASTTDHHGQERDWLGDLADLEDSQDEDEGTRSSRGNLVEGTAQQQQQEHPAVPTHDNARANGASSSAAGGGAEAMTVLGSDLWAQIAAAGLGPPDLCALACCCRALHAAATQDGLWEGLADSQLLAARVEVPSSDWLLGRQGVGLGPGEEADDGSGGGEEKQETGGCGEEGSLGAAVRSGGGGRAGVAAAGPGRMRRRPGGAAWEEEEGEEEGEGCYAGTFCGGTWQAGSRRGPSHSKRRHLACVPPAWGAPPAAATAAAGSGHPHGTTLSCDDGGGSGDGSGGSSSSGGDGDGDDEGSSSDGRGGSSSDDDDASNGAGCYIGLAGPAAAAAAPAGGDDSVGTARGTDMHYHAAAAASGAASGSIAASSSSLTGWHQLRFRQAASAESLAARFECMREPYLVLQGLLGGSWTDPALVSSSAFKMQVLKLTRYSWSLCYEAFVQAFAVVAAALGLQLARRVLHSAARRPAAAWQAVLHAWYAYRAWLQRVLGSPAGALLADCVSAERTAEVTIGRGRQETPSLFDAGKGAFRSNVVLSYRLRGLLQRAANRRDLPQGGDLYCGVLKLMQDMNVMDDGTRPTATHTQEKLQGCFGYDPFRKRFGLYGY